MLVACALTAIVALGIATDRGFIREVADAPSVLATSNRLDAPRAATAYEALGPHPILQRLVATHDSNRFPEPAFLLEAQAPILANAQIVSYYGNPYTADMGILGTADLETIASQLEEHAARYDKLNGATEVVPALHLVYAVAQRDPTDNGLYLQYVADAEIQQLLALTEEREMLLFIDLQIGRSTVEAELAKVLPLLRYPQVHLALDPEFAIGALEVPGVALGSLRASDIDEAQAMLQRLVETEGLPPKLLIVHQFLDSMVLDGEAIRRYADVELIIDMDGFGPAEVKRVKYQRYAERPYASRAAIKLFLDHDPDLMSEADVLSLEPMPAIVIYQ